MKTAVEIDPIQYEIFRHRLWNLLEEGRVAIGMVSGSPVVVEGKETMCAAHLADGSPILVASGILLHAVAARDFIYNAIEWYEEDPGINDGDQFFFNDPYIGGQHLSDMVIIKPIFYQGRRIGWTSSIMHTAETGGIDPGGQEVRATEIFHEGIRILGLKIVEGGKFRPDVFRSIADQVRDPHLVGLDAKAKIAANNVCAAGFLKLVEQFGLDFVEAASSKMIDDAEKLARARLASLPDGIWRSRLYGDTTGREEKPLKVICQMAKEGSDISFDFTGTSPQVVGSINLTYPAAWGQLFVSLCSQLFWNVPWNQGMMRTVKLIVPEGSLVNCRFPAATSLAVATSGILLQGTAHECIAKMLFAAGILEDVNAGWRGSSGSCPYFGGINQFGAPFAGILLDSFAGGCGATPTRDGVHTGGNLMAPQATISDVEITEMNLPFLCLGRRQAIDSGGFGKFAGGMGPEPMYMIHGARDMQMGVWGICKKTHSTFGLFGGYPGANNEARFFLDTKIPDWAKQSKRPEGFDAELGEIVNPGASFAAIPVKNYDVIVHRVGAGGGYGDPLEREPESVAVDVKNLVISAETAHKVYGVVYDPETFEVDTKVTNELRERMRQERLKKAKKVITS